MIFSPLDLVFFQQIFPKKVRVQSWQHIHIQQQIRQKKLESSPTTHVTETRFLRVLDPPDHFGTIYIFDDFSPLDLVFFQQIFPKKVRVQSWQHIHIQQQIRPKKLESSPTTHVTETRFLHVLDPPDHFGTIYIFDEFFQFFFQQIFPKKVRVQSWQHIHIQQQIRQKKLRVHKTHPKKLESSPTTHVTETRFLHVYSYVNMLPTLDFFRENLLKKILKKIIENVDGTKMIRRV